MFGFQFLNGFLLWGLAALAVPVLIHLLFHIRRRTVEFSSIEFILASSVRQQSRARLKELLLLLLRMAALGLLVLAFARPVRAGAPGGGAAPSALAIVLDDTLSMQARVEGGTAYEWARAQADRALAELPGSSSAALIPVSAPERAEIEPAARVAAALAETRCTEAAGQIAPAVRRAIAVLEAVDAPRKRVLVLSDFQKTAVEGLGEAAKSSPRDVEIVFEQAPDPAGPNYGVSAVETAGDGRHELEARLDASNVQRRTTATFSVRDGQGRVIARRSVDFSADGARTASVALEPSDAGPFEVRIEGEDCLAGDNRRLFVPDALERLRVLFVEEDAGAARSASRFVRTALCPGIAGGECAGYRLSAAPRAALTAERLANADVLVLCDVPGLTPGQVEAVETFVRAGRGCVVFLGPRSQPDLFNAQSYRSGTGFLPCPIGHADLGDRSADQFWFLSRIQTRHPLFAAFREAGVTDPSVADFTGRFRLDEPDDPERVAARFDDGKPAIVVRAFGKGRSVLVASTADRTWNDMPLHKFYVPLVHGLVGYAAGKTVRTLPTWTVGRPIRVQLADDAVPGAFTLTGPGGKPEPLAAEGRSAETPVIRTVGLYRIAGRTRTAAGEEAVEFVAAVNVDPRESDMERARPDVEPRPAAAAPAPEGSLAGPGSSGIAHWLFLGALCVLAVELLIANRAGFH